MGWRQFEPDATMSLSSYLDSFTVDDLENLTGPWETYPLNSRGDETIDVLQDLGTIEEVPNEAIEGVPNTVEVEEGELPMAPIEIPVASFGSTRRSS